MIRRSFKTQTVFVVGLWDCSSLAFVHRMLLVIRFPLRFFWNVLWRCWKKKPTSTNLLCNLLCGTRAGAACPAGMVLFCIILPAGLYPCVLEITLLNAPAWKFSVRIIGLMFSRCIAVLLAQRFSGDSTAKVLGHQCLKWGNLSSLLRHNSRDCFLYHSFCVAMPIKTIVLSLSSSTLFKAAQLNQSP